MRPVHSKPIINTIVTRENIMRNVKFIALIAVTILFGAAVINSLFFPLAVAQGIEKYVGISVLIMVILYFVTWYRRTKRHRSNENNKKSIWLLMFGILCLGLAFGSMILIPIIFPNLDARGAKLIFIGFIAITFVGAILMVQWLVS